MISRATADSLADDARPPYPLALAAFVAVLAGYVLTLAPTVTFWDAGEFIATAHILGIPHPPGTPLFVMLGRFWDILLPGVTTAFATNLMSAMFSAGSAAFLFLFVHESLRAGSAGLDPAAARVFRIGGGFAATLVAAFGFTVWQNSVETEVYQVAMFSIGLIAWLMWLWRRERGGIEGAHVLLATIYVMGVALGNHLMALLIGPAVFAFMFHVLRTDPAAQEAERNAQWAQFAVAVATWVALVGVGVGSKGVIIIGLALFLVAAVWAVAAGTWLFALMALVVAAVGASTYLFLFVRAGLHPYINEADPSTLQNLWAVIRREQYPPRSPFDNPIYPSGPDNPGRTLQIFGLQLVNWLQYFDWQWSSSLQRAQTLLAPARLPFTVLFTALGIWGATEHRRWDRSSFWFLATAFATTSIGLILYLNFKPGFSIGYEWFPDREAHEVRERDYFYTVSFVMWGLWAGMGIAALFRRLRERLADGPWLSAAPVLLLALLPFMMNFKAASRRHGPTAYLARDFAYNMLIGIPPYGILFTNGDNDTFPLWYLQEVEQVRQDVVIVNLSLVNTDWYIRQLRDNPARAYRPDSNAVRLFGAEAGPVPACSPAQQDTVDAWAARAGRRPLDRSQGPTACLHTLNDDQVNTMQPYLLPTDLPFRAGRVARTYPAGTPLYVKDIMTLRLIQENIGRRPIYFALTAGGGARMGLERYISQEGLAFKLHQDTVSAGPGMVPSRLFGTLVDLERTRTLLWETFRFARLFDVEQLKLDPTDENIAGNLSFVYLTLGDAYAQVGDAAGAVRNYEAADHLAPNPELRRFLDQLRGEAALPGLGDTAAAGTATPDSSKR